MKFKRLFVLAALPVLLGGCVVAPVGPAPYAGVVVPAPVVVTPYYGYYGYGYGYYGHGHGHYHRRGWR